LKKNNIVDIKNLFFDKNLIYVDEKHVDTKFLDEEQNNIWINIHETSFWYRYRNNLILNLLNNFSNSKDVIDIGSGIGTTSIFLDKKGFNVESIEPSYTSCMISKKRGVQKIINTNIYNNSIKFEEGSNVLLLDVLEHIDDHHGFIKRLQQITKKTTLILSVPAYDFLWSDEDNHAHHYRRYTLKQIKKILLSNNFKITYSSYFFSYLVPFIFLLRTLPSKINRILKRKQINYQHHNTNRFFGKILKILEKFELSMINKKINIPFGSSIIVVANN